MLRRRQLESTEKAAVAKLHHWNECWTAASDWTQRISPLGVAWHRCFFNRDMTWRCQAEVVSKAAQKLYNFVPETIYYRDLDLMTFCRRGWALQERILAPRTLHFTQTEVFWGCHQKVACETFPDGFTQTISDNELLQKRPVSRSMWQWIVESYSRCELTKSSDKLVAISGLARNMQLQTGEQYVAGLRREDIEQQLCWPPFGGTGTRSTLYRAPTWSWASHDGTDGVVFPDLKEECGPGFQKIKVLQDQDNPSGHDVFRGISSANLRLSCGMLIHVTIRITAEEPYMVIDKTAIKVQIWLDNKSHDTNHPDDENGGGDRFYDHHAMPVQGYRSGESIIGLLLEPAGVKGEF